VNWSVLVVDEAHRLKNENSRLAILLRQLHVDRRLLLTGTPIQNNVRELFSLLHIMNPEKWEDWEDFSMEYCGGGDRPTSAEQATKIKDLLRPILLRRMKEDVETLPTKEEVIVGWS